MESAVRRLMGFVAACLARRSDRERQLRLGRRGQLPVVEVRPRSAGGGIAELTDRLVNRGDDREAVPHQRDVHRPFGQAVEEVDGSFDSVHDPPFAVQVLALSMGVRIVLEPAGSRTQRGEGFPDAFGAGLFDPLVGGEQVVPPGRPCVGGEELPDAASGLPGDLGHLGEEVEVGGRRDLGRSRHDISSDGIDPMAHFSGSRPQADPSRTTGRPGMLDVRSCPSSISSCPLTSRWRTRSTASPERHTLPGR
jgi:hypothetical protein